MSAGILFVWLLLNIIMLLVSISLGSWLVAGITVVLDLLIIWIVGNH